MMILWPRDAVSHEALNRSRVGARETGMALPKAEMLVPVREGSSDDRIERIVAHLVQYPDGQCHPIGQRHGQFGSDDRPETMANGQNIVDVQPIKDIAQIFDMSGDAGRRHLAPCRTSAAKVDRYNGDRAWQTAHDEVPRTSITCAVVQKQHRTRVLLDPSAAPDDNIITIAAETNPRPPRHIEEPPIIHRSDGSKCAPTIDQRLRRTDRSRRARNPPVR